MWFVWIESEKGWEKPKLKGINTLNLVVHGGLGIDVNGKVVNIWWRWGW